MTVFSGPASLAVLLAAVLLLLVVSVRSSDGYRCELFGSAIRYGGAPIAPSGLAWGPSGLSGKHTDLYVSSNTQPCVVLYSIANATTDAVVTRAEFVDVEGLTSSSNGHLFVLSEQLATLWRVNATSSSLEAMVVNFFFPKTAGMGPTAICTVQYGGGEMVYIGNENDGTIYIYRHTPGSTALTYVGPFALTGGSATGISGLAYEPTQGLVFVTLDTTNEVCVLDVNSATGLPTSQPRYSGVLPGTASAQSGILVKVSDDSAEVFDVYVSFNDPTAPAIRRYKFDLKDGFWPNCKKPMPPAGPEPFTPGGGLVIGLGVGLSALAIGVVLVVVVVVITMVKRRRSRIAKVYAARALANVVKAPIGETLAFVFTDVQCSTKLWEFLPDGAMSAAILLHNQIMRTTCAEHKGYEVASGGDGFFFVFPTAGLATKAILSCQEKLLDADWSDDVLQCAVCPTVVPEGRQEPVFRGLRVRMALHVGSSFKRVCAVSEDMRESWDYLGNSINLAARLEPLIEGGQTAVSAAALKEIEPLLEPRGTIKQQLCGTFSVKGIEKPVDLFYLVSQRLRDRLDHRGFMTSMLPSELPTPKTRSTGPGPMNADEDQGKQQDRQVTRKDAGISPSRLTQEAEGGSSGLEVREGGATVVELPAVEYPYG